MAGGGDSEDLVLEANDMMNPDARGLEHGAARVALDKGVGLEYADVDVADEVAVGEDALYARQVTAQALHARLHGRVQSQPAPGQIQALQLPVVWELGAGRLRISC
ncbi:hypothetical protein PpBr36_08125 [Pyricularia pennisetigena]|uniref:hypothetical protein n=1 Tax=Pyricularia pennisetigena TaxID=1578925 RepID=UPI001154375E|nr:hypothetical protein PpBr36_08125 [Pyricularia pennisetigena]TLS24662.1 hypothetical protein PpBr36_08125 [Pyricularia pennisetigena]